MTVTVQVVAAGRSLFGSSVIVDVPEPLTEKVLGVPLGHWSVNELVVNVTASLKLIVMFVLTATCVAPFAGEVVLTDGAASAGPTKTGNSVELHCEGLVTYRSTPVE